MFYWGIWSINSVRNKFESANQLIRVNLIQVSQLVSLMFLTIDCFEKNATKMEVVLRVT